MPAPRPFVLLLGVLRLLTGAPLPGDSCTVAGLTVPAAAVLYLLTTTAWTAAERAWLHRDRAAPVQPGAGQPRVQPAR